MTNPGKMSRTAIMVEGALMVALAFALSAIPPIELPFGGSITFFSTLPIIVMSLRHNCKWGLATAAVYSLTQTLQGMDSVLFMKTIGTMALCALLDYILAYTSIGLAGPIARKFKNGTAGIVVGVLGTGAMRYICSFFSGILLWRQYATPGMPVWQYSLTYNASWLWPDVAIALAAVLALSRVRVLHLLPQRQGIAA